MTSFDDESTTFLPQPDSNQTPSTFPLDPRRYYVLILFALLGTQQTYVWYTFASVPTQLTAYFALTKDQAAAFADLSLSYGAIILLIIMAPCMWALTGVKGLQIIMRLSAFLTLGCCVIRSLPSWFFPEDPPKRYELVWMLHIAQILNAAAGATYLSAGSRLSAVWFPPHQRTFATAVALTGGNMGMIIGYGLGAGFSYGPQGLPQLLFLELGLSIIPAILVVIYCPVQPEPAYRVNTRLEQHSYPNITTPFVNDSILRTPAADVATTVSMADLDQTTAPLGSFFVDVCRILAMPSMWFLLLAGGIESGANAAWGGLLPQIFETRFEDDADAFANKCGLLNCSGSLLGMLVSGWIADKFFQRKLKQLMLIYFTASTLLTVGITLMFPTPWSSNAVWPASEWQVAVFMLVAGGFQGCLDPLFLELAAEITFPSKEGTSGGLSFVAMNVAALAVLLLAPVFSATMMNTIYSLALVMCVILTSCVTQKYLRTEHVEKKVQDAAS